MSWSNCVVFAVSLWMHRRRRMRKIGRQHLGSIVVRRSRHGPFFHVLYGRQRRDGSLAVVSYVPRAPKTKAMPPPCFGGMVAWGDAP